MLYEPHLAVRLSWTARSRIPVALCVTINATEQVPHHFSRGNREYSGDKFVTKSHPERALQYLLSKATVELSRSST